MRKKHKQIQNTMATATITDTNDRNRCQEIKQPNLTVKLLIQARSHIVARGMRLMF